MHRQTLGAFQRPFLMAFDLSPQRGDHALKEDTILRSAFPHETLDVMERVRRVVSSIRRPAHNASDAEKGAGAWQPHSVSMHIEHTPDEFCGVCGVDSLEGEGAGGCEYQVACNDSFVSSMSATAMQLFDPAPAPLQAAEPHGSTGVQQLLQSPDAAEARFAILASLDVITTAATNSASSFDTALLRDAISSALGSAVDDPYHAVSGEGAVQVEVVRSAVDEMFAHMFADELRDEGGRRFLEERGDGGGNEPVLMESQRHRVILTTASQSRKEGILQALGVDDPVQQATRRLWAFEERQGAGTGGEHVRPRDASILAVDIASFLDEHRGEVQSSVERVDIRFERLLSIPASDAALVSGFGSVATDLGALSVMVTDPTMPREPLSAVVYGKAYRLVLEKFPPRTIVRVVALRAPVHGQEGDESDRARVLATIVTDEKGAGMVPFFIFSSDRLFPPGDYEIQALMPLTQAFGLSPLLTLSHEGPERKLFRHRFKTGK